ncbi:bifunctional NAD(P)H-hydrate repair enzyme [Planobispora rosea]|uniref:Bifunctional NAD(P)H-hydrate repair enzyme n=1 Tax=Planobispora rosea TaxID=35762 RepID=A0A8J3WDH2_PLARO|nr:NAD(P)H-hydrate dehydratase [Planobispora rosea]GGS80854.1 bifunctional NAD(P)H-hydrate repair enzyme [Planobispora rosea]GIH85954.1 bifunctional NAD(P)H-hydrate repair enzyme [Planobispora rosea]
MRTAYTSDQIRAAEAALMATLPEGTLMRRAAAGLAVSCAAMLGRVYGSRVVVLAGSGDNGGDALYAGARLAARGARVHAVLAGSRVHEAGLAALRGAGGRVVGLRGGGTDVRDGSGPGAADAASRAGTAGTDAVREVIDAADLVLDGLVGIGGTGALREPYARLAAITEESAAAVVAVDVPSGVDASSGRIDGRAVRADLTVTFGALKIGLLVDPGSGQAGRVELVDIGLGPYLPDPDATALTGEDVALRLPRPGASSDKYRRGVVGVAAGSRRYTGAAVLAVGGAIRAGAGMVRYAGAAEPVAQVRARWPEAVITELASANGDGAADPAKEIAEVGRVQAWVLGPGLGTGPEAHAVARAVLASDVPVLVDADGLTLAARERELLRRRTGAPVLITPHAGELSRLLGVPRERIEARRLEHARQAAAELGVTVLLKGSTTLVAEEGRPVRVNPTGSPWLATGGTGDVLAGLAGTLLAAGLDCYDAASCAAYLHGIAGQRGPVAAADVAQALPEVMRSVINRPRQPR